MGNTVLSKRAAADLQRYDDLEPHLGIYDILTYTVSSIKAKHSDYFRQVDLFRRSLIILESHHFRLPARRFALDLFDKTVMRQFVLDEDCFSDLDST
jgi:rapamycin-insensitive companion of mTOR